MTRDEARKHVGHSLIDNGELVDVIKLIRNYEGIEDVFVLWDGTIEYIKPITDFEYK